MVLDLAIVKAYYAEIPGALDTSPTKDGSSWTIPCSVIPPNLGFHFDNLTPSKSLVIAGKYLVGGGAINPDMSVSGGSFIILSSRKHTDVDTQDALEHS